MLSGFAYLAAYVLRATIPSVTSINSMRPHIALICWYWNINQFAIGYLLSWLGNLGLSARELFTPFIATHVSIRTSDISSILLKTPSQTYRTLPYHIFRYPQLRCMVWAPIHLPRRTTQLVSYYAFFKGWLLLSQLPSCFSLPTSFPT